MLRRTLSALEARCNDGSPAALYIRPANALSPQIPASRDWLIFFDGGGNCSDADACLLTRWCSGAAPGPLRQQIQTDTAPVDGVYDASSCP